MSMKSTWDKMHSRLWVSRQTPALRGTSGFTGITMLLFSQAPPSHMLAHPRPSGHSSPPRGHWTVHLLERSPGNWGTKRHRGKYALFGTVRKHVDLPRETAWKFARCIKAADWTFNFVCFL